MARGYYAALWTACSEEERLVLVQLAEEQFANPRQVAMVRRLLQRGLLVRDRALRLMNDSFRLFVERFQDPAAVTAWERPQGGLGWAQLRWGLLVVLVAVAAFLFVTQKDLFDKTIGFVSALAVAVPGLLKLVRSWALRE